MERTRTISRTLEWPCFTVFYLQDIFRRPRRNDVDTYIHMYICTYTETCNNHSTSQLTTHKMKVLSPVNNMGVPASKQRFRQGIWQEIFSSNNPHDLIAVVYYAEESETEGPEKTIRSLD